MQHEPTPLPAHLIHFGFYITTLARQSARYFGKEDAIFVGCAGFTTPVVDDFPSLFHTEERGANCRAAS
jgi:hypothetical protein